MFRSVVVGTDGSTTARTAVRAAAQLAAMSGADLHIVCAYRSAAWITSFCAEGYAVGMPTVDIASVARGVAEDARRVLEQAQKDAAGIGVDAMTHAIASDPCDALCRIATLLDADLVVVGDRGMSGASRMFGSVPNKVTHHAPCSVLVVDTTSVRTPTTAG
jgi:nucleotide-binding universal stress UspA family protein